MKILKLLTIFDINDVIKIYKKNIIKLLYNKKLLNVKMYNITF